MAKITNSDISNVFHAPVYIFDENGNPGHFFRIQKVTTLHQLFVLHTNMAGSGRGLY
jgi:hypothetical protein